MHPCKRDLPRVIGADQPASAGGLDDIFTAYGMTTAAQDLQRNDDGTLTFRRFTFTPVGLQIAEGLDRKDWDALGAFFKQTQRAIQWWIGDWINAFQPEWGKMYDEAQALSGLKYDRLKDIAYVARSINMSFRNDQLTFTHHQIVASLPPEEQRAWLARAVSEHLSVAKLKRLIAGKANDGPKHELLNKSHRRQFNRLWSALQAGQPPSREDIQAVREWLNAIDNEVSKVEADVQAPQG